MKAPGAFHKLSLVALLAWVGLGADGLSSSAYGPDEAFRALGEHTGLAFFLALATAATVTILSDNYTRIIEQFPSGGGGYVVASKLLHPRVGVVSGSALLIDYVLTITISIASGADAIFSFLPPSALPWKLPIAFAGIALLTVLNIRGAKESVTALVPIFVLFLITHVIALAVAIGGNAGAVGAVTHEVRSNVAHSVATLGIMGLLGRFVHAYSMGGGTYTGIEAVSNGVAMMREPRVRTAKRTMILMAVSLALTAGGILLSYLLVHAAPEPGKTMNAVLFERIAGSWKIGGFGIGNAFVIAALVAEGTLLFVAAQAGFLDGPRVMANMATDSWLPHRFAALSDRLSMRNGVMIMAGAAFLALAYTRGDVSKLVVMYSINVFLTFSLSNLAMVRFWIRHRKEHKNWGRSLLSHSIGLLLCLTILVITVREKFAEGGWITIALTGLLVIACMLIKRHYSRVVRALQSFDRELPSPPGIEFDLASNAAEHAEATRAKDLANDPENTFHEGPTKGLAEHHEIEPSALAVQNEPSANAAHDANSGFVSSDERIAILLVGGYSGLGRHALLTLLRMFPHHFSRVIFVSVAVVDSESFKGADQLEALELRTRTSLLCYERYAATLGLSAASAFSVGTEVAIEVEKIAGDLRKRYRHALFVAGQLLFEEDTLWNRILHNETALMVQERLQRQGIPMIVVPVRIDLTAGTAAAIAAPQSLRSASAPSRTA